MMQNHSAFDKKKKKRKKDCSSGKVFTSSRDCIMLSTFPQVLYLTDKS